MDPVIAMRKKILPGPVNGVVEEWPGAGDKGRHSSSF
jgi:hypothetical protein